MVHTLFHGLCHRLHARVLAGLLTLLLPAWAQAAAAPDVYLYVSPTTQAYLQSQNQAYGPIIKRWQVILKKSRRQAQTTSREQLLAGLPSGTLILPSSVALDEQERLAIQRFVAQGGNLLGTGLVGSRHAQGHEAGLDFLQSTFHVQAQGFYPDSDDAFFMPFGDGPLTWPIPAGRRMPLLPAKQTVLRLKAEHVAAVAMDWSRSMDPEANAVMAYHEAGASRLVYFSFPDTAWPDNQDVQLVLDASLAWLRREPMAYKAAWPNGYVASHLIEMDTEDKFPSAIYLAQQLEGEGLRGTFYCLTSEAARSPKLVHDLMARGHEIAYHADVHFGFNGDALGEQALRIQFMKQQMQGILGPRTSEVTGFRAPTESYDATTESLLYQHGLLHHAADESASEDRLPFFSDAGGKISVDKALVVLPRTQRDDINFQKLQFRPDQVAANLLYDLDLTVQSGAFSLLSVHSQNYVNGGLMQLPMKDYVRKVATYKDRLWVARADELTAWWRQREPVNVSQKSLGSRLQISVQSPAAVSGLSVFVTLPHNNAVMRVADASSTVPVHVKPIDAFRSALVFDRLTAGQTSLKVTFGAD